MDISTKPKEEQELIRTQAELIAVKLFTISPSPMESMKMFRESLASDTPPHLKADILTDEFFEFVDKNISEGYASTYAMIADSVLSAFDEEQFDAALKVCSDSKWDKISGVVSKVASLLGSQRKPLSESMLVILAEFRKRVKLAEGFDYKAHIPPISL